MKSLFLALALAFSMPLAAQAVEKAPAKNDLKLINVSDLDKLMTTEKANTYVFDANTEDTRKKDGLIPGATKLNSSTNYDVAVLPADKKAKLVFYCANTQCMASHEAAKRAISQGYANSMVMSDGIQGWKKAGKPIEKLSKN